MWHDLRQAVRMLTKHPGFVALTTLVLALGIGLNTAIFSIVRAMLFTTLPVPASHQLVSVYQVSARQPDRPIVLASPQYDFLNEHNELFSGLTAQWGISLSLRADDQSDVVDAAWVLSNYFTVLGVPPALGRALSAAEDDVANPARAVVISHDLWNRRFRSDPAVIGKTVEVGLFGGVYTTYTVVGVAPPGFRGVSEPWKPVHVWMTFAQGRDMPAKVWSGVVIGRMRPGVDIEQARAVVVAQGRQEYASRAHHDPRYEMRLMVYPTDSVRTPSNPSAALIPKRLAGALTIVVAMVLLVAAANIAGLLLARGVGRSTEIAIRRALGAGPRRIVRQLLAESLAIALVGGVVGLLLAQLLIQLFRVFTPVQFALEVSTDGAVLIYTVGVSLISGVLVGVLPARQARSLDILPWLAGADGFQTVRAKALVRRAITVPQVAVSLVLLLTAGVYIRDLLKTELADLGYQPQNVLVGYASLRTSPAEREDRTMAPGVRRDVAARYAERARRFYQQLFERLRTLPGTRDVAITSWLQLQEPAERPDWSALPAEDAAAGGRDGAPAQRAAVSPGYFATLGITLVAGRDFDGRDTRTTPKVAVVGEALARRVWPGRDAIGRTLALASTWNTDEKPEPYEVVGVVKDVTPILHERDPRPIIYLSLSQEWRPSAGTVLVRGAGDSRLLLPLLRDAVQRSDDHADLYRVTTMSELITGIMYPRRIAGAVLAASGLLTLFLATIGVYGVVSYAVAQRRGEIAVRLALGAERRDIVRLVLHDGAVIAGWGAAAGLVLGYVAIRLTSSNYLALPQIDLATLLVTPLVLTGVVLLACYLPARAAGRFDPLRVLRRS
jgi:predicted permease